MTDSHTHATCFGLVVIGGGPAGLAPLLAAHRSGGLEALLRLGVAVVEQSPRLGAVDIGSYVINSDSTGATFFDCLRGPHETKLTALQSHPLARRVAAFGEGPVPLSLVGEFLQLVGAALGEMIAAASGCAVFTGCRAIAVRRRPYGWTTSVMAADGTSNELASGSVVTATGAHQPAGRLASEQVAGVNLADQCGSKLLQSGEILSASGWRRFEARVANLPDPQIAVIGGSTSAGAVLHALLHRLSGVAFVADAITLLHRRPLRVYYPSVQGALADGFAEFGENDICPISQRLFRFAGMRLESRDVIMRALQIGGRQRDPRLRLHRLQSADPDAIGILRRADIVIAALGYRPRAIRVRDENGTPIELQAQLSPASPLVDRHCRVLDAAGDALPGLFGIGLAAGFRPDGALGGEPSFSGQVNGLWLWQNDVGQLIADGVMRRAKAIACRRADDDAAMCMRGVVGFAGRQAGIGGAAPVAA